VSMENGYEKIVRKVSEGTLPAGGIPLANGKWTKVGEFTELAVGVTHFGAALGGDFAVDGAGKLVLPRGIEFRWARQGLSPVDYTDHGELGIGVERAWAGLVPVSIEYIDGSELPYALLVKQLGPVWPLTGVILVAHNPAAEVAQRIIPGPG